MPFLRLATKHLRGDEMWGFVGSYCISALALSVKLLSLSLNETGMQNCHWFAALRGLAVLVLNIPHTRFLATIV